MHQNILKNILKRLFFFSFKKIAVFIKFLYFSLIQIYFTILLVDLPDVVLSCELSNSAIQIILTYYEIFQFSTQSCLNFLFRDFLFCFRSTNIRKIPKQLADLAQLSRISA